MSRIRSTFEDLRRKGRPALMPYLTVGHPSLDLTLDLVPAAVEAGADLIELGIPFSDPLADGATVQHATQTALEQGTTLESCFETMGKLREQGIDIPLIPMGYYNPILQRGTSNFCKAAAIAGADGIIVPDLPPEEADELWQACQDTGLDLIFLLAPTSDEDRIKRIINLSTGFIYLVSLTGVTGARDKLPVELESFVQRVRSMTDLPLAVGFGIGSPAEAQRVAQVADGVIVGSAIVQRAGASQHPVNDVRQFVAALRNGLDAN